MTSADLRARLISLHACPEAVDWLGVRDLAEARAQCPRADWMLWLAEHVGIDWRVLQLVAADIAEDVLPIYESAYPDDDRPRRAIEVRRRWVRGEATEEEWHAAWAIAQATARACAWDAASDTAARAAAWAIAQATARACAWDAALAAAEDAVSPSAWLLARATALARYADMVRARISVEMIEAAMEGGAQ